MYDAVDHQPVFRRVGTVAVAAGSGAPRRLMRTAPATRRRECAPARGARRPASPTIADVAVGQAEADGVGVVEHDPGRALVGEVRLRSTAAPRISTGGATRRKRPSGGRPSAGAAPGAPVRASARRRRARRVAARAARAPPSAPHVRAPNAGRSATMRREDPGRRSSGSSRPRCSADGGQERQRRDAAGRLHGRAQALRAALEVGLACPRARGRRPRAARGAPSVVDGVREGRDRQRRARALAMAIRQRSASGQSATGSTSTKTSPRTVPASAAPRAPRRRRRRGRPGARRARCRSRQEEAARRPASGRAAGPTRAPRRGRGRPGRSRAGSGAAPRRAASPSAARSPTARSAAARRPRCAGCVATNVRRVALQLRAARRPRSPGARRGAGPGARAARARRRARPPRASPTTTTRSARVEVGDCARRTGRARSQHAAAATGARRGQRAELPRAMRDQA